MPSPDWNWLRHNAGFKTLSALPPAVAYPLAGRLGHRRFDRGGALRQGL